MDEKKEKEIGYCDAEGENTCCGMCSLGFLILPLQEEVYCVKYDNITLPHMKCGSCEPAD